MNHHKAITSRLNSLAGVTKPKGRNTFKTKQPQQVIRHSQELATTIINKFSKNNKF